MEMKIVSLRKWLALGVAASLFIALGVFLTMANGAQASPAAVGCGDVLGPGGNFTMTEDLTCSEDPALTVVGPADLNMAGHTLTCDTDAEVQIGIEVSGRAAEVFDGTIDGCGDNGVHVAGSGRHTISDLEITSDGAVGDDGIDVDSNRNTLEGNTVTGWPDIGILIDEFTRGNMVTDNTVTGNVTGIETDTGATGNTITDNNVTGNTLDLFDDGEDDCDNTWTDNTFTTSAPAGCIN